MLIDIILNKHREKDEPLLTFESEHIPRVGERLFLPHELDQYRTVEKVIYAIRKVQKPTGQVFKCELATITVS